MSGDALRAVLDAYVQPGRYPAHHRRAQADLARTWPTLSRALRELEREAAAAAGDAPGEAEVFLSRSEVAAMIGVQPSTLSRYQLPAPDVVIGDRRGWRAATIAAWHATRPRPRGPFHLRPVRE